MPSLPTEKLQLAAQFVNSTASHIFLTGKAGTGKTTFLHQLGELTHKNFLVVAPTGIAALNAKGVTIHSQFLLPLGSFLPQSVNFDQAPRAQFYTRRELARKHSLNSARKQVLRSIDLLIIDEVSMLRADVLDAIDYRLKSAKGNFKRSFGGVQLLMIGDLFQLPPIVKDEEWAYLKDFYKSPHFFESQALKEEGFTYIELDKIFRQQDEDFIRVLNNLRNDRCTAEDLELLNANYIENAKDAEGAITVTTHNYRADRINREELDKLEGPSFYYEAQVQDKFPEHLYPMPESLELRVGAQVMFIKNDTEGQRYFNGKLARVTELEEDGIKVEMEDGKELWVDQHRWENLKYKLDESSKELEEEVIGSFTQYPLRLAWAVTVHKSQGLTFDRAVIDVGQAFAPGQVYVALSRLRSLDGLMLRTRISESVISSDAGVVNFARQHQRDEELPERLNKGRKYYLYQLLNETFDFEPVIKQIEYVQGKAGAKMVFEDEEMQTALSRLREAFKAEVANTAKFRRQLAGLLHQEDTDRLLQRIEKGSGYYQEFLWQRLRELLIHHEEVKQLKRTKTYRNALEEIDQLIYKQLEQVQKSNDLGRCILAGNEVKLDEKQERERQEQRQVLLKEVEKYVEDNPKNLSTKTGRKRKKRSAKGETYQTTYALLREGLKPEEIAERRGFAQSTIEGHLAKGIAEGEVELGDFIESKEREAMEKVLRDRSISGLNEAFKALKGQYSYGKLRMVVAHLGKEE